MPSPPWSRLIHAGLVAGLLSLGLAPAPSFAGWIANGTPIVTSPYHDDDPRIVSDGNGGAIISWTGGGNYCIGIDGDGNVRPGWPAGGAPLPGSSDPHLTEDGAHGAFWVARDFGNIYFWHIRPPDSAAEGRAPLETPPRSGADGSGGGPGRARPTGVLHNGTVMPYVTPDGEGGAYICFGHDERFYEEGLVRHQFASGSFIGLSLSTISRCYPNNCSTFFPAACQDGSGGALVGWGGYHGAQALRFTRDLSVAPGWPDTGLVVGGWATYVGVCTDNAGGAYIAWQAYDLPSGTYLQRVTASGAIAAGWPDTGIVLSPYPTLPGFIRPGYGYFCSIVPNEFGGALVAWTDQRHDTGDIYVQRVRPDGTIAPGWASDGVAAGVAPGMQQYPMLVADGSGGAIVVWQDERSDPDFGIYANHIDGAGALVPPGGPDGVPVSRGPGLRLIPRIASDGQGGAITAWMDYRSGPSADIYAARLYGSVLVPILPALLSAEARSDAVDLAWFYPVGAAEDLRLERRTTDSGLELLAHVAADALGWVQYTDRAIEAGHRYGYRLGYMDAGEEEFTDEVWVTVPSPKALVLEGIRPNPSNGPLTVRFALPGPGDARLELLDLAGRVWILRDVGSLGAGWHEVELPPPPSVAPGIFYLRLRRSNEARVARVCLMR